VLWNASSQSTAATGLVYRRQGSYVTLLKSSLLNRLVRTVRAGRPPGVVVSDLTK
jgi:hypothetical protein